MKKIILFILISIIQINIFAQEPLKNSINIKIGLTSKQILQDCNECQIKIAPNKNVFIQLNKVGIVAMYWLDKYNTCYLQIYCLNIGNIVDVVNLLTDMPNVIKLDTFKWLLHENKNAYILSLSNDNELCYLSIEKL